MGAFITVPGVYNLHHLGDSNWASQSTHLAFCRDASDALGAPAPELYVEWLPRIAFAGMVFTAYAIADLGICFVHNVDWKPENLVHHMAFIGLGLIIRSNCCLAYEAAILLAMEVSTPFLKVALILKHRDKFLPLAKTICGMFFALFFVVFRMGVNSWGTYMLIRKWHL